MSRNRPEGTPVSTFPPEKGPVSLIPTLGRSFLSLFSELGVLCVRRVWISFQSWSSFSVSSRAPSRCACLSLCRESTDVRRAAGAGSRARSLACQSISNVAAEQRA